MKSLRRLYAIFIFAAISTNAFAQAKTKPYKIFTSGREITIKSSKEIEYVMVWTTDGDRVVEQKGIKEKSFRTTLPIYRKAFFLMVCFSDKKVYTEKIGIQ
ncbi:MAG TPA: hypothetical protein PK695_08605 [Chitinophagaceae bacterium]|nr:hypothetical protein [Chitinophagaceae bacterium]HNA18465.1 hypothetical protein [Chitinophagaceae bacterium]HNA96119.1 hypothetical protein [Chitinophagaceae bacterium]HND94975.1 hypothetical protein [Chitinophagaceae bacterium]HNF37122.1 hypothetical protein [Chitinophagaceae bacterium]